MNATQKIVTLGILAVLSVSGVISGLVWMPRATITVSPAVTTRTIEREIILSQSAKDADYVKYILPAQKIEKEAEEMKTIQRSTAGARDSEAKGTVILKNDQADEQPLLPKTHLRHEGTGAFFLTDQAVRIPPQGEVTVTVTAETPGQAGNVPAGKFIVDRLPVSMQKVVYGESTAAFTGGVVTDSPITENELKEALKETEEAAQIKVHNLILTEAGGAVVRDDLIKMEIESQETSAADGDKVPEFEAKTKIKARGFIVSESDLLSLTLLNLRSQPDSAEELVSYDPESFKVEILRADFDRGEARIKGTMTGSFAKKSSLAKVDKAKLAGRSEAEISEYFAQFDDLGEVKVALWPFWVKTVPAREKAVRIELQAAE